MQVFLGGTCGSNNWREEIVIPSLLARGVPEQVLFNPVVEHWDEIAQKREDECKRTAMMLYVIASPDPTGQTANVSGYSIVEAVMGLYDAPERTIVAFDLAGMEEGTAKRMNKAARDLCQRFPSAPIFTNYDDMISWLVVRLSE